ncbi:GGDEF domain-containing phosphodiesterase [Porticoccus sp. W117]|uniref:putative bifunctional diguanylate cyclase/phosphodiesterase n=1 Tax=Porticoccus sp. W117 TaxID=3054777 RepID=UPI002597B0B7|nr:GGDEF domain-containing phosphodiesterase [Porticoccus sp. W117]MDM3870215.1 GGDEF domain-containing phosphodiesterase [Porticoccus sp. W117]
MASYLGLVDLADYEHLVDTLGSESAKYLRQDFFSRLQEWPRPDDKTRILKNQRFLVIFKGMDTPAALELATAKLARLFEEPCDLLGDPVAIPIHAGFTLLEDDTQTAIQEARAALRSAKRSSTLYQLYSPEQQGRLKDEVQLISNLEAAVELGELQLYYQPKVHARHNNLVGAEALVRWHTKNRKVLEPSHFIDAAERHQVIRPMTWWAIKSAVATMAQWSPELGISVNITPSLLMDDEVLTVVRDALDIFSVTPSRLTLEVTENIMADNQQVMLAQLAKLRKIGVRVSIDDFGTGYSSLAYFRDLPADELKIDKNFVVKMLGSPKDQSIAKTVIELAHNFSLKVVAEGVESKAVAVRLKEMGCDILQGHYYDQPLPLSEFDKRYKPNQQ